MHVKPCNVLSLEKLFDIIDGNAEVPPVLLRPVGKYGSRGFGRVEFYALSSGEARNF